MPNLRTSLVMVLIVCNDFAVPSNWPLLILNGDADEVASVLADVNNPLSKDEILSLYSNEGTTDLAGLL